MAQRPAPSARSARAARADAVDELMGALLLLADADRAAGERAYLKSAYTHLGVRVPARRKVAKDWLRGHRPHIEEVVAVAEELWDSEIYERRGVAVDLIEASVADLGPDDLGLVDAWVRDARTWALVDPLAHGVAGRVLTRFPASEGAWTERWRVDPDFWVRRTAVLCLSRPVRDGAVPFTRFEAVTVPMLPEHEFFVRKAIGWVLREVGRARPDVTGAYCTAHIGEMSGVTWREARKPLDPGLIATLEERRR